MNSQIRPSVVASAQSGMEDVVASQVSVRDLKTHLSEWLARAQSAKLVRIGSPDLGTAGKPSPGGGTLAIVQANKWLEEEFAKDGIEVQWNFFRGAGPAVA